MTKEQIETSLQKLKTEKDNFNVADYYNEMDFITHLNRKFSNEIMNSDPVNSNNILQKGNYDEFREAYQQWLASLDKELCMEYLTLLQEIRDMEQLLTEVK